MARINYLNLIGAILIIASMFLAWFNFNLPISYGAPEKREYAMVHCYMSPFVLTINLTATSNMTVYTDIGVLHQSINIFYSPTSTLIGIGVLLGTALSSIGELKARRNVSLGGGLLSLLSAVFFFLAMPPYVMATGWVAQWGFWVALTGDALLLCSVAYRTLVLKWNYREDSNPYAEP